MSQPMVSVLIPTMNEAGSIGRVIEEVHQTLGAIGEYEILVVDTNSTDGTVDIARSKGAKVIDEPRRGYGRAYKTGFEHASGRFIATLDADSTYPARYIPEFIRILEDRGMDFVMGDRLSALKPGSMSKTHRLGNWILNTTLFFLFGIRLKDSQTGMWVFRREILSALELRSNGMPLSEEIKIEVKKKGFKVGEIPIEYRPRAGTKKLSTWKDGWNNWKFLFSKRFARG